MQNKQIISLQQGSADLHAKFFLLTHTADEIIWIQHGRYRTCRLVKGCVIRQTSIPEF